MEQKSIQLEQVIRIYGTKQMYILNKQYIFTEQMKQRYIVRWQLANVRPRSSDELVLHFPCSQCLTKLNGIFSIQNSECRDLIFLTKKLN